MGLAILMSAVTAAGKERSTASGSSARAPSTFRYVDRNGERMVELVNRRHDLIGGIAGRPPGDWLVIRTEERSTEILDNKGGTARVTVTAWPLSRDFAGPPLYTIAIDGVSANVGQNFIVIERGIEDVRWSSIYRTADGSHLFDSFVSPLAFAVSSDGTAWEARMAGLYLPPDDEPDPRLKRPGVVGVLSYASPIRGIIRQALITADDAKQAALLRSYWEEQREMTVDPKPGWREPLPVKITIGFFGEAKASIVIPVLHDDLGLEQATLTPGLHISSWQR